MRYDDLNYAKICVVIPCYRVSRQIADVIRGIPSFVHTIIAVDDGSPDETGKILDELARDNPKLVVIHHSNNQGVGGAMITGYKEAISRDFDVIVKMDGDGQMDPSYIEDLVEPILNGDAEYVTGNRFYYLSYLDEMPWLRRIGNLGLSFLVKAASGYWNIFDPTNGFTAISIQALEALNFSNIERRYLFEISMLVELYRIRARIEQIPMPARYRGEISGLNEWTALIEFSIYLARVFIKRILRQYFWQNITAASLFIAFGTFAIFLGGGFGAYHWIKSAIHGKPASAGTVMIAAILIILGFQLLLHSIVLDISEVPRTPPRLKRHKSK